MNINYKSVVVQNKDLVLQRRIVAIIASGHELATKTILEVVFKSLNEV